MSQVLGAQNMKGDLNQGALLRVKDLDVVFTKQRGFLRRQTMKIHAVKQASFDIYESEVFSIVGESGSGKTTIARCVAALTRPNGGKILWKDTDMTFPVGRTLKEYRRNVQIVYQDPYESLNPRQDVFKCISAPILHLTEERDPTTIKKKVEDLLEEVGLSSSEHMYRLPHQLSGGERQRVNIARALAPNPTLLIADEPTTMLDASQRLKVLALLTRLKRERNLTVLLITHDLAVAKLMSQRSAVMYLGRIVESGPTDAILSRPHHPYSELIVEAIPDIGGSDSRLESFVLSIEESQLMKEGCVFRPRCRYATEICKTVEPELSAKSEGHMAACHNALHLGRDSDTANHSSS